MRTVIPHDFLRPWLIEVFSQIGAVESDMYFVNGDPTGRLPNTPDALRGDTSNGFGRAIAKLPEAAHRIKAHGHEGCCGSNVHYHDWTKRE